MIRSLLITDRAVASARATDDVDAIVQTSSRPELYSLHETLRELGFVEDSTPGAPICRWLVSGVRVDVMPTDGSVLGFRNRWYEEGYVHAIHATLEGERFRILDAPHFVATKLEAWSDRSAGDLLHHDLEDVIAIVDGRPELLDELARTSEPVREYVRDAIQRLLASEAFVEALPGHLAGDPASQARVGIVKTRLEAIASLR